MSLLRSVYHRPCVDHEGLANPVDLWLACADRFHPNPRRKIPPPAEVLPCWRRGIEAVVTNPALRPRRRSFCQAGRPAPLRSAGHPSLAGKPAMR